MKITPATLDDAESILALQHLAYQSEAAIYDDYTLPPLLEMLQDLKAQFECRRRGIGTALLRRIETLFPAARRFELFTGHKSESNLRLYQRLGYRAFRRERAGDKVTLIDIEPK